ncbi:B box and SPRY domain-containing protein [Mesocricetus auratus]|uniref:B box and SPRY domain-containing protein n=1 Tax=Mesocricetus auratus TaxID=10036 RepID=A0ABM2YI27_MESAU|nr:B box and SPRY domain-containing protein [Mesocricetus auratus]
MSLVRSMCESEGQQLLEQVYGEEKRVNQSILTELAYWTEELKKLDNIQTSLVGMLTHLDDLQLVASQEREKEQEVFDRQHEPLALLQCPAQRGVLLDLQAGELLFCEPALGTVLHIHRSSFSQPLSPVFAVADQVISIVHWPQ